MVLIISISVDYPRRHIKIYNLWFLSPSISSVAPVDDVIFFSTSPRREAPLSVLTLHMPFHLQTFKDLDRLQQHQEIDPEPYV